ncbi:hypothetical protein BsWGS_27373 [Bradybaena similaris]
MCLLSLQCTHRIPRSILQKLQCISQRQSLFSCKQQLKDLKKDEFDHYMEVRFACVHYIKVSNVFFKARPDTYAIAISILDVFLWKVKVTEKHMSIVSAACYFIAAKMLESDEGCLSAKQLAEYHNEWTAKDLQRMELHILGKLGWCVTAVSYLDYLPLFAVLYGVNVNLAYSDKMMALAERCLAKQSTVLMKPGVLAHALLQQLITPEVHSSLESQVLVHCNIQESDLDQCKQLLSCLSSSTYSSPLSSPSRPKFPLKVFDKPSEMGVTCLPTIVEEPSA